MKKTFKLLLFIIIFSFTTMVNASTYFVTGEGARVRSSAENLDTNIIGRLSYGTPVEVISLENSWYKIKFGDGYGYITYRYISSSDELHTSNTIAKLKSKTSLKKSNSAKAKTLVKIPKNAVVKVLEQKSKWTKVEYNEKIGYVKTSNLKKINNEKEIAVGTYTINFALKNSSRKSNISKSIKKLNKVVIKNGEKFSFIKKVGKSGYKKAPEFNKNTSVYGGGLSEVATSLYLAIRDAQRNDCYIQVTEQNRYGSLTPYAKLGEEAMINLKSKNDLVFVNKSGKNIKIYANVSGNNISFVISEIM